MNLELLSKETPLEHPHVSIPVTTLIHFVAFHVSILVKKNSEMNF